MRRFREMGRKGFTLIELLMAIVIRSLILTAVLLSVQQVLQMKMKLSSRTLAWQRGQNVLAILDQRVKHAGLGLSVQRAGDLFRRSFGGGTSAQNPPPASWTDRGPIQIWRGLPSGPPSLWDLAPELGGVRRGRGLAVLYGVPSYLKAKLGGTLPLSMNAGVPIKVKLEPHENLSLYHISERLPTTDRRDLRAWVTFPLMGFPVYVSAYSAGELTIRLAEGTGLTSTLYPYDEMHYLRGERFQVRNDALYSEDLTTTWTNFDARIEGVLELWFEWTASEKRLEAWVLTSGGRALRKSSRPRNWPAEAAWNSDFERHEVLVLSDSWILHNM